jgi:hypothetical protein
MAPEFTQSAVAILLFGPGSLHQMVADEVSKVTPPEMAAY